MGGEEPETQRRRTCSSTGKKKVLTFKMKTALIWSSVFALFLCALYKFAVEFCATQCFTRVVPLTPNHGLLEIPRVKTLTSEELELRIQQGMPVIATNQMDEWPAMKRWQDLEYFAKTCPHFSNGGVSMKRFISRLRSFENEVAKLDLSIDRAPSENEYANLYFSHNEEFFHECPELWKDVANFTLVRSRASAPTSVPSKLLRSLISQLGTEDLPQEFVEGVWIQAVTWIGPGGSKTKLHYDDDPVSVLHQFKVTLSLA